MTSELKLSVNFTALALASGLLLAAPATAADLPPMYAPPPPAPVIGWGGIYLGGHIGAGQAEFDGIFDGEDFPDDCCTIPVFLDDLDPQGVLGGVHAGFNWDSGAFVLGVEGDVSFMDWNDNAQAADTSEEASASVDMLASIRARIGMPMGAERRVMPYVTAGAAWADAEASIFGDGRHDTEDLTERNTFEFDDIGGVVGGGVEYAVTEGFRVRGESLFYFFDEKHNITEDHVGTADEGDFVSLDSIWTIRVGGSWHFSTPGF